MKATQARASSNRPVARPYQDNNVAFPLGTRPVVVSGAAAAAIAQPTVAKKPTAVAAAAAASGGGGPRAASSTNVPRPGGKISTQRYDVAKCADPFQTNTKRCKTAFSQAYCLGQLPVRLQSSAAKYSLQWDEYARAGFSKDLFVLTAAGLLEVQHPYRLLAPMMFQELIARCEGHAEMLADSVVEVSSHLRAALLDAEAMEAGLNGTLQFAQAAQHLVLSQLPKLVPALVKCMAAKNKKYVPQVLMIFGIFEQTCGPEATKIIKSKYAAYQ